jgi:IS30 family transposase
MRKYPRIEIDQKAFDGLQIEAVLKHKAVRDIATEAILGYISKESLSVLDHKTYTTTEPIEPTALKTQSSTQAGRRGQLARDEAAVAQIKKLWTTTDLSITDIAAQVGAARQTVDALIRRLIERGELAQRAESGQISGETI